MFWPAATAGRLTVTVFHPLELLVQADCPPSGLSDEVVMLPLYPLATKLPPAERMSVNAPPPILISSTPPSKRREGWAEYSKSNECRKESWALVLTIGTVGLTSAFSPTLADSELKAALGA